jgi:hypothetical protein
MRNQIRHRRGLGSIMFAATACALSLPLLCGELTAASAQEDVASFYGNKSIRMVAGQAAGSGIDLTSRLLARHLHNHIPGRPNVVVQNMPGAAGLLMTNNLYNSGARDGTVIGAPSNGVPIAPLLQPNAARFDPTKLIWIGSIYRSNNVVYVWHSAPVQSLEQLKTQELLLGALGPGSATYDLAVLSRDLLGLKFKIVRGYQSTAQVNIAMERGEIHAQILGWEIVKAQHSSWVRDKLATVIGHFSLEDPAELRPYPRIFDLARTEADRQALRLVLARQGYGGTFFLPPGVPADRVEALRRAFDATMKDPAFRADAKQMGTEVDPMTGEETQALIAQVHLNTPPEVAERVRGMLEAPAN